MIFFRCLKYVLLVLATASVSTGQLSKCDQTPPDTKDKEPREDKHPYRLDIDNAEKKDGKIIYTADQTYVCKYFQLKISNNFSMRKTRNSLLVIFNRRLPIVVRNDSNHFPHSKYNYLLFIIGVNDP